MKNNTSIKTVKIRGCGLFRGAMFDVLDTSRENNYNLESIYVGDLTVSPEYIPSFSSALSRCTNSKKVVFVLSGALIMLNE